MEPEQKNWKNPFYIAIAIAVIGLIYYVFSGHSSLDLNTRKLTQSNQVDIIDTGDPQKIQIKCKNGESYQIVFKQGQQNYDNLIFNACGSEGTQQQ